MEKFDFKKVKVKSVDFFEEVKDLLIRVIKSPMSTYLEEIKNTQIKISLAFILFYGLIFSVVALRAVYKVNQLTRLFMFQSSPMDLGVYIKAFFSPLIAVSFYAAVLTGLFYLLAFLLKRKACVKSIFTMVGMSYIPTVICSVIALILSIISSTFGLLVIAFGLLMSFIMLFFGAKEILNAHENLVVYFVPFIIVLTFFLNVIVLKNSVSNNFSDFFKFLL